MTARRIVIRHDHISEELTVVRRILKDSAITEVLQSIDNGYYGFTLTNLRIIETVEVAIAVFIETAKQLKNIILMERGSGFAALQELSGDDIRFINMFSVYTCATESIEQAVSLKHSLEREMFQEQEKDSETFKKKVQDESVVKQGSTFKLNEVEELINYPTEMLPKKIIKDYLNYLKFYRDHPSPLKKVDTSAKALNCSIAYFKLWKNSLEKMIKDSSYALYREALEETYVNVLNKVYTGFHHTAEDYSDNSELMKIETGDVIGNQDYLKAAMKLARDVAGFDFKTWQNPKQINPVLFAMGNPGCGKTVTAHAVGNYFLDFCKQRSIRARFVIIRRTDWASSYQNASANQLIDIFKRNVLDFRGIVGIYWPDIDTAFAARGDSGLRNEEKNILGAVFGLFDGTILPKNGQWFMMTDANYLNMDKATISRITQDPYYVKGPTTPEDFVALFRDVKLRKHKEFLQLDEEGWIKFGQKCVDCNLSGRSIENISRKATAMIEDFDYPEEYFESDLETKKEIIHKKSKRLEVEALLKLTDKYIQFEKEAEEKSSRQKFKERVEEITNYLSAEKFARESLKYL